MSEGEGVDIESLMSDELSDVDGMVTDKENPFDVSALSQDSAVGATCVKNSDTAKTTASTPVVVAGPKAQSSGQSGVETSQKSEKNRDGESSSNGSFSMRKRPRPGKPFKEMTVEEKKAWRVTEREWNRERKRALVTADKAKPVNSKANLTSGEAAVALRNEYQDLRRRLNYDPASRKGSSSSTAVRSNQDRKENAGKGAVGATRERCAGKPSVSGRLVRVAEPSGSGTEPKGKRRRADRSDVEISPSERQVSKRPKMKSYRDIASNSLKLYIRKKDNVSGINREEYEVLASQLQAEVIKKCLDPESTFRPVIVGNFVSSNGFCIVCGDQSTFDWLKLSHTHFLSLEGHPLEFIEYNTLTSGFFASVLFPGPRVDIQTRLELISALNPGIMTKKWRVRRIVEHEDNSTLLHVFMDKESRDIIEEKISGFCVALTLLASDSVTIKN
ncbi:hypothetical protein DMENIID0001_005630 [Sergentomyia squamirostris]